MAERAVSRIPTSRDRTSPAARPDLRLSSAMSLTSVLNDKGAHRYGPGTAGALRRRNFDADRRSVEGITRGVPARDFVRVEMRFAERRPSG
jgi:hypothetical protein